MDDAGLHPRLREDRLDRLREAPEAVDAGDQDVCDAAAVQVVENGEPELRALGLLPPDPEHVALALDGDPDGEIAGAGADGAVLADLHQQTVEVDDRIHRVQRPGAPRGDVLEHGVGDRADRVAADLHAVELAQVRLDVAHGHAAGVEPEDLLVQPGQPGLALAHELGVEAALAVARRLDLDRPELGLDRLGSRAVAVVAGPAGRRLARRKAEMLGQLGAQRGLDHPARELREQPTRTGDLVRIQALERVLQRIARQQAREAIASVLDGTLITDGASEISLCWIHLLLGRHGWLSRPQGPRRSPGPHTEDRTARSPAPARGATARPAPTRRCGRSCTPAAPAP